MIRRHLETLKANRSYGVDEGLFLRVATARLV